MQTPMRNHTTASDALAQALNLCRGDYQRDVARGAAYLSGAGLRGAARRYSARYADSRHALLGRMDAACLAYAEVPSATGRRSLVYGTAACQVAALLSVVARWDPSWPGAQGSVQRRVGRVALAVERASLRGDERAARAAAAVVCRVVRRLDREHEAWMRPVVAARRLGAAA